MAKMDLRDVLEAPEDFEHNGDEIWETFLAKAQQYINEHGGRIVARHDYHKQLEATMIEKDGQKEVRIMFVGM